MNKPIVVRLAMAVILVCTLWITVSAWKLNRDVNAFAAEIGVETGHLIGRR